MQREGPVVCGHDGSAAARAALPVAAATAARHGLPLRVVTADAPPIAWQPVRRALDEAVAAARSRHAGLAVTSALLLGRAADALVAESVTATRVVVGTHGVRAPLLGSTATRLAAAAHCPVVAVPEDTGTGGPAAGPGGGVVVAVDPDDLRHAAPEVAAQEAVRRGLALQVLAVSTPGRRGPVQGTTAHVLEPLVRALRARHPGLPVSGDVRPGDPVDVLRAVARAARLLVVGTRQRGAVRAAVLGSVSRGLLTHADQPLVVVPDEALDPATGRRART